MNNSIASHFKLTIAPLGAGDLIDRAVRLYRKHFWTFVLIAAPPVIAGTLFSVGWTMAARKLFFVGSAYDPDEMLSYWIFMWFGGALIWLTESIATLTIMGGASRNFVRHLLFGEPLSFRETYRNTRQRIFGLILASAIITVVLIVTGYFVLGFVGFLGMFVIAFAALLFQSLPGLAGFASIIVLLSTVVISAWLFFLIAARFAYVPQVMLVEGLGVFESIGRSMTLASGNVKRYAALFIFTIVVTYSALALLYIPLGWYAWASGVQVFMSADTVPAWYEISQQLIGQISFILLMPVWMIGLCLLYVDERVRHEGYDIELMAARQLGEIPAVPAEFLNPLQPALSRSAAAGQMPPVRRSAGKKSGITSLGLDRFDE